MGKERKAALLIVALGLLASLALSALPLHHTYPAGTSKDVVRSSPTTVNCGGPLLPRNPAPPAGQDDECDSTRMMRLAQAASVGLAVLAVGGLVFLAWRRRTRGVPAPGSPT